MTDTEKMIEMEARAIRAEQENVLLINYINEIIEQNKKFVDSLKSLLK